MMRGSAEIWKDALVWNSILFECSNGIGDSESNRQIWSNLTQFMQKQGINVISITF